MKEKSNASKGRENKANSRTEFSKELFENKAQGKEERMFSDQSAGQKKNDKKRNFSGEDY